MKRIILLMLISIGLLGFIGCGRSASTTSDSIVIGWHGVEPHPYIERVQRGAQTFASEHPEIILLERMSPASSTSNQAADIEAMIAQGARFITAYPADASAINGLAEEWLTHGVQVVLYGAQPLHPTPTIFTVGTDIYAAAVLATETLIRAMGGSGNILNILENLYDPNTVIRKEAIEATVARHAGVEIVMEIAGMGSAEEATERISAAIGALGNNVNGALCTGVTTSIGLANVLTELTETGRGQRIHGVTLDTHPTIMLAVEAGIIDATLAENPNGHGYLAMLLLKALADGYVKRNPDDYYIDAGMAIVTRENAADFSRDLDAVTAELARTIHERYLVRR